MSKKNLYLIKQIMYYAYWEACHNKRPMSVLVR